MTQTITSSRPSPSRRLPSRPCPTCGLPSAAALVTLPSGRRALIEACAVCGRQHVSPARSSKGANAVGVA